MEQRTADGIRRIIIDRHYHGFNPLQFGDQKCSSDHSFGPAVRMHWLLHYVVKGQGIFIRNGEKHHVKAGDMFVIPPYVEHYYAADAEHPWEYIWIGFTAEETLPPALGQPIIHDARIGPRFEDMMRCYRMENGQSAFLSSRLWELMSILLEQEEVHVDYIQKALSCMYTEYMTGITVSEVAERLNLDRSYFSMLFKKKQGISPQQYLLQLRLTRAAELMTVYGERPSVAGMSVGYPDLYHFSKIFKAHYGLSPREYQKQYRVDKE